MKFDRFKHFARDEQGMVAVYLGIAIALLVGISAMAVDLGRSYTLNSELKSHADAAAIAGATQLDGTAGAIARATTAASNNFVQNQQTFATGAADIQIAGLRFLHSLPPLDTDPITAAYETTDDAQAQFIEVTVETRSVANMFIRALGGPDTTETHAISVAGFTQAICNIPPIMICNPNEDPSFCVGCGPGADFNPVPSQQIRAKLQGSGSQWVPGGFGYLDPPWGSQSASDMAELLASANPNVGCINSTVSIRPGQVASAQTGINTRFDMYENPFFGGGGVKNNPDYRPAKNVTKGMVQDGTCNASANPGPAMALPRDQNLIVDPDERFGDENWDRAGYWMTNHGGVWPPPGLAANASRYDTYRYEIDMGIIPNNSGLSPQGEDGNPQCHNMSSDPIVTNESPDRRIMIMAVINCIADGPLNGNETDIPVKAFVKAFITEPATDPGGGGLEIMMEMIEVMQPGDDDGVLHDMVQLYR